MEAMPAPGNHGGFILDHGLGTLGDGALESENSPKANMIGVIEAEENVLWG